MIAIACHPSEGDAILTRASQSRPFSARYQVPCARFPRGASAHFCAPAGKAEQSQSLSREQDAEKKEGVSRNVLTSLSFRYPTTNSLLDGGQVRAGREPARLQEVLPLNSLTRSRLSRVGIEREQRATVLLPPCAQLSSASMVIDDFEGSQMGSILHPCDYHWEAGIQMELEGSRKGSTDT